MSYSSTKAFEFSDDGLIFTNGVHVISGSASPVGNINPTNHTIYFQSNGDVWQHSGSGTANTWILTAISDLPSLSEVPVFAGDGTLTSVTYYSSATQTTPNRIADITYTYDGNFNPATEVTRVYSTANGTTILSTITKTFTFTANVLTNVTQVTT